MREERVISKLQILQDFVNIHVDVWCIWPLCPLLPLLRDRTAKYQLPLLSLAGAVELLSCVQQVRRCNCTTEMDLVALWLLSIKLPTEWLSPPPSWSSYTSSAASLDRVSHSTSHPETNTTKKQVVFVLLHLDCVHFALLIFREILKMGTLFFFPRLFPADVYFLNVLLMFAKICPRHYY